MDRPTLTLLNRPTPFDSIFPDRVVPVLSPTPDNSTDEPCYILDHTRLSQSQKELLARELWRRWQSRISLKESRDAVANGCPISAHWFTEATEDKSIPDCGPCCSCGKTGPTVRNFLALPEKAPIPGTGWGCTVCGLPQDGALAILCDQCLTTDPPKVKSLIYGYPAHQQRYIGPSLGPFDHDYAQHPEAP
ncbi:hypothetical protein [Anthocerotibacter panamensis]|uniref:hypothetical protein n=1 Tax=Anthocerotibacter panamensis TaxID=2857077 RepID=UPI001C40512C|nr:hypothetical protein [Anthocerotibacter panamensis]